MSAWISGHHSSSYVLTAYLVKFNVDFSVFIQSHPLILAFILLIV